MMTAVFMLFMQTLTPQTSFIVSTKAGLVNYVQGSATERVATSVAAGKPISTGAAGALELLLNPGSYLRMGENSTIVLEKVELTEIAIRIEKGSAIIEATGVDKDLPLRVSTGKLSMDIIKEGIYLFADGKIVVVDGKIRDAGNGLVYGKGYQISDDQGYRAQKVKTFTTSLELWSQKRDALISQANLNVARSLQQTPNLNIGSFLDVWLWYPVYGSFIYMPGGRYRSPYGYTYQAAGTPYGGGYFNNSGNGGNSGSASNNNGSSGGSSSGSSGATGGGGGFSGGSSGGSSGGGGVARSVPTTGPSRPGPAVP